MKIFLSTLLILISFNSFATVKFAPQLLELDPKKRSAELTVINDSNMDGVYEVKLVDAPYEVSKTSKEELELINKSIRFSPKRFTVKAKSSQKVRVILRKNNKLSGPFLRYIKLSPIYDPTKAEKDSVAILQDFIFPLYTFFKIEKFDVELKSLNLEKIKTQVKDKKTKKVTNVDKLKLTIGYTGIKRSPTRAKYDVVSKDGKVLHSSSIIFKKSEGSVEKFLPDEIKAGDVSKVRIRTFIGKEILKEMNF